MPIGYYNQSAAREQERKHKRHALEAGLLVGAIIGRKPLGIVADKLIGKLAASPTIQAVSQKMATKALNQLEHISNHLSKFDPLKGYYKDTGGLIGRRDLADAENYLQGKLTRDLMYSEAAHILPQALLSQRGKAVGGTWTQEGVDALIEDQGFFRSILYKHEYTDEVSNLRSKISNSQNGAFYKYLEKTNQLDAAGIHRVASELTDVIWGVKNTARSRGAPVPANGIGVTELWKTAGDRKNHVRGALTHEYSKKVIAEAKGGQSNWEKLFGLQNQKMSDRERMRYETSFQTGKGGLEGLTIDRQNNRFTVGDRAYNFSALGHMGRNLGSFMNERLSIPFSPLQTSISPGQLFPFIKRHGDSPQIGTLSNDFKTGKLSFFVRNKKVNVDTREIGRAGYISIDPHRYDFLLVNKRHLRNLSDSQRHADTERERRAQAGEYSTKDQVKDFFRPNTTAGSVPYPDAPQAFLRKWSKKKGRSYLPNLLSNAAKGDVQNDREVLALINAMQHGARDINDDATLSAYEALKEFKVQQDFGKVAQHLRNKENTSAANWANAHGDLRAYFNDRPTTQARIRKLMEELEVYKDDPRALEAYLNRTASFRASRDPEKFLGLHLGTGVKRLTHLDILRHDLMLDFVAHSRLKGVSADQFAAKFAGTEHTDALALTHASELERIAYESGSEGVNAYIKARPEVQGILNKMSKNKRNFLELQPKQEAEWEDFAARDRMIIMRKHGEDYGEEYERNRAQGHSVSRSLLEATSWKQLYNARTAALGTSIARTAFDTTAEQIKIVVKGLFGGIKDADGNLAPQGVLGGGTATQSGLNAYWMMDRLHEAFESVGWGLPDQYKTSAGTLGVAMLVGRFLPLTLIPEAHKLYNRITRDIPFLRWANTDIARSHALKVAEHVSHHVINHKHLTSLLPGLDFYTDSRDKREEDIHERYGDFTPVRKGRWWLFGSREAVFGQKISYYIPSAQRIALSDWQGASNVDGSSWRHFAHAGGYINPSNWFGGQYWYENAHKKDRGILESGAAFDPDYVTSTPLNLLFGNILKPRRIYHPEYLPKSLGGKLESLPSSDRPTSPDFVPGAEPNQSHAMFAHESDPRLKGGGVALAPGDAPGINPQTVGWKKRLPHKMKLQDPSRSSLKDRVETGSDAEGFRPSSDQGISSEEMEFIRQIKQDSPVDRMAYQTQELTGLYGWMAGQIYPDLAQPVGRIQVEDASRSYGVEARFWDQEVGGIGGTAADIARRLFPHRRRSIHSYNPTPNNMPEWLPDAFRHGDPYRKLQMGELRLPGQAYSRSHPGTMDHVWDMRASSLGGTSEEIKDYFLHKGEDNQSSEATETGTKMHRALQARWKALGILEADEVSVYDKKDHISGHIDAILRMPTADGGFMRVIDDIKTKTPERFAEIQKTGKPEEENLEQIQFYMHTTGIHHALLTYVNRDSPEHVFEVPVEYDPVLYAKIRKKLDDVRNDLKAQIKSGDINEGAVYNAIDKYEILSEVAPDSSQFMQLQKWAGMHAAEQTPDDQYRIKNAQERMRRKREGFELHPYRFKGASEKLTSRSIEVAKILSNTAIEDTRGRKYTLAGITTEGITSPYETPKEQWDKVGKVREGSHVQVLIDSQDKDKDSVQAVVLHNGRNVAKGLLRSDLASEKENDFSATAVRNRFTTLQTSIGSVWETMAHADTFLNTKFLPVRSGLEQYERTDVYGKKSGSWDSPMRDYILPTLASFSHQNPIEAAAKGAFFFSLFGEKAKEKAILGLVGGAVGLAGATLGKLGTSRQAPPIPSWVRKRRNIEEYYDNLTYLKYSALANKEAELAYSQEKTNVSDLDGRYGNLSTKGREQLDSLSQRSASLSETTKHIQAELQKHHLSSSKEHALRDQLAAASELSHEIQERKSEVRQDLAPVGPHAMRALLYRQRALGTIRGATESGSVNQAIAALPTESRQAIASVIKTGSKADKQRLYNLLPNYQKSALGYYLGVDPRSIPKSESLSHYFEHHALPRENWKGWRPDMSLDLIEVKDIAEHHKDLDPMDFNIYPSRIEEATLFSPESSVPSPAQGSSYASIGAVHGEIERLLSGKGLFGIKIRVEEMPASSEQGSHQASVNINVNHRREHAFMHHARNK